VRRPHVRRRPASGAIFDAKPGFVEGEDLVSLSGPEAFASGVTESLLMAWADGQDFAGLGWRGLDEDALTRVFALHQAEFDLRLRTPYVARPLGGPLARRILATLETRRRATRRSARRTPGSSSWPVMTAPWRCWAACCGSNGP
jgi:hypothetical protein